MTAPIVSQDPLATLLGPDPSRSLVQLAYRTGTVTAWTETTSSIDVDGTSVSNVAILSSVDRGSIRAGDQVALLTTRDNRNVTTYLLVGRPDADSAGGLRSRPAQGFRYGGAVVYAGSGTFAKADYPGLSAIVPEVVGAGGGGGGRGATSGSQVVAAGGAGGGGYGRSMIYADQLQTSETVTVGGGGAGGASGGLANGTTGDPSSFGNYITANGGTGGGGAVAVATTATSITGTQGSGGTATAIGVGAIAIAGGDGGYGLCIAGVHLPGSGGASGFGYGGERASSNAAGAGSGGTVGHPYGGGGSGAHADPSNGAVAGAAGADGIVIVHTYY